MCDFLGSCVACVSDADCGNSQLRCLTGVACVNKNPISSVTRSFLSEGWTVIVTPGYEVSVQDSGSGYMDTTWTPTPAEQTQIIRLKPMYCVPTFGGLALPGSTVNLSYGMTVVTPAMGMTPATTTCSTSGLGGTITLTATAKK